MKKFTAIVSIISVIVCQAMIAGCNSDPDADKRAEFDANSAKLQEKALEESMKKGKKGGAGMADMTLDR